MLYKINYGPNLTNTKESKSTLTMKTLLKQLITANSTPEKGELKAARCLEVFFAPFKELCHVSIWDGNRAHFVLKAPGCSDKKTLIFVSHLDVVPAGDVPWHYPPFEPVEKDGRIFFLIRTNFKPSKHNVARDKDLIYFYKPTFEKMKYRIENL